MLATSGCVTPFERSALLGGRDTTIDNVQGPTERRLRNLFRKQQEEGTLVDGSNSLKPIAGTEEYVAAEELYENEQYEEAQAAFKKVAKKYKKSEIREDAKFMQAESAYNLGHYAKAQDLYSELLKDYPSTRHLDDVSKRLFEIARLWLDFPEPAGLGEVQQVNYEDFDSKLPAEEKHQRKHSPFTPNLTDKSRPLFDTEGNGVGALRLIWLNDPTGPLADDALMLAASHYARTGNFIEADRHYTLLREEYPNSPHVQNAFVLGSHVKLMSYEGPNYDGKSLQDAQQLKQSILRLYPDLEDKERIERELARIEDAKAAREWELVIFYERKGNKRAQAIYCHLILQRYPTSRFAEPAKTHLAELGPEYATGSKLLIPTPDPPRFKQTFARTPPPPPPNGKESPAEAKAPLRLPNPFRRDGNAGSDDPKPIDAPETMPGPEPTPEEEFDFAPQPSPGNEGAPETREVFIKGEDQANGPAESAPSGGGWTKRFRFSPPKLLSPNRDAKPATPDAAEEAASKNSGTSKL